jgi:hypothetical protein
MTSRVLATRVERSSEKANSFALFHRFFHSRSSPLNTTASTFFDRLG